MASEAASTLRQSRRCFRTFRHEPAETNAGRAVIASGSAGSPGARLTLSTGAASFAMNSGGALAVGLRLPQR